MENKKSGLESKRYAKRRKGNIFGSGKNEVNTKLCCNGRVVKWKKKKKKKQKFENLICRCVNACGRKWYSIKNS